MRRDEELEKLKLLDEVDRRMGIAAVARLYSVKDWTIHFVMKNDEKISGNAKLSIP
jgi:hypothetical protein